MIAIKNFLEIINENWTTIVVIIGLIIAIITKIMNYLKLSKEEKIEAALKVVKAELLKLMSQAEIDWENYVKSGELKKSQVITDIYTMFPFLKEYVNQDTLIERISEMIKEEKSKMDKIINNIDVDDIVK